VWLADISYIPTDEGWLYLAAVAEAKAALFEYIAGPSLKRRRAARRPISTEPATLIARSLDLHKGLHDVGCALLRDRRLHLATFDETAEYLQLADRGIAAAEHLHRYSPETTRSFRELKVWMMLKHHGIDLAPDAPSAVLVAAQDVDVGAALPDGDGLVVERGDLEPVFRPHVNEVAEPLGLQDLDLEIRQPHSALGTEHERQGVADRVAALDRRGVGQHLDRVFAVKLGDGLQSPASSAVSSAA
jgi:hypothetical protein